MNEILKTIFCLAVSISLINSSILAKDDEEYYCYECSILEELSNNIYYYQYQIDNNIYNEDKIIEIVDGLIIYRKNLDSEGILDKSTLNFENIDWTYISKNQISTVSYDIDETISGISKYNGTYALPTSCNNAALEEITHNYYTSEDSQKFILYMTRGTGYRFAYEMETNSHWADVFKYVGSFIPGISTFLTIIDGFDLIKSQVSESNSEKLFNHLIENKKVKVTIGDSFIVSAWDGKNIEISNYSDDENHISVRTSYHCFSYDAN